MRTKAALAAMLPIFPAAAQAGTLPPGFVRLRDIAPGIVETMAYAGADNFTGRPVPGYGARVCWLLKDAALGLAKAQAAAQKRGLRLVVYDCYRPQRATDAFVRWAQDERDQARKGINYPDIAKRALFAQGYIARFSGHSTGAAVDIGLADAAGRPLDFGTPFDFFGPRSWTAANVPPQAQANRALLKSIMTHAGFVNYAREWWHYSLRAGGWKPARDVPITAD